LAEVRKEAKFMVKFMVSWTVGYFAVCLLKWIRFHEVVKPAVENLWRILM